MSSGSRFERIAAWSHDHHWRALTVWLVILIGLTAASTAVGGDFQNDNTLPGTDSQRAADLLDERAPDKSGDSIQVVVRDRDGLRASATRERVVGMLDSLSGLPQVAGVSGPYGDAGAISADETIGFATLTFDEQAGEVPEEDVRQIIDIAQAADGDGLRVELGGDAVREAEESGGGAAEGIGVITAMFILIVMFGSLLAASLPIVTAVFAVGTMTGLIVLASHFTAVANYTLPLMTLVGLGVGIDYALLIFSRFGDEVVGGASTRRAVVIALDTAGRSVFFAACTVVIALLGLYTLGLASLQGVALALALTVLMTMLASITLLPALLHLFGGRLERRVKHRARRDNGADGRRWRLHDGRRWRHWSALVARRPWPVIVGSVALLLLLAAPVLGMRLGFADAGNDAESTTARQAYDLLSDGFGPGFNGPLLVVAQGDRAAAETLQGALAETPGIAQATEPSWRDGIATVVAFPETSPQDEGTARLLARLRTDLLPGLERQTGATFLVGGQAAAADDFSAAVAARMPLFLAVVVGLSALLLVVVFRSLLIPIKAALLNLLSIGAALGLMTLVFQDGNLGAEAGPIEAAIPLMIFAIVFGLSMDYEVFLVSRMREEWDRTNDAPRAIGEGLARTGRVITAAGAIMVVVFGAFVLSPDRLLQQFGFGLAIAVALDAFLIRCLLVPAIMHVLGSRAWWLPAWLGSRLPRGFADPA